MIIKRIITINTTKKTTLLIIIKNLVINRKVFVYKSKFLEQPQKSQNRPVLYQKHRAVCCISQKSNTQIFKFFCLLSSDR